MVVKRHIDVDGNIYQGKLKCKILKHNCDITEGIWEIAIDSVIAKFNAKVNTIVRCELNCLQFFEETGYQRGFRHGTLNIFHLEGVKGQRKTIIESGEKMFTSFKASDSELVFHFYDLERKEELKKNVEIYMSFCLKRVE